MGGDYNIPLAANAKTVREFDEGITRVDDYYSQSSSSNSIKHVSTPLLCIQAANDPIAPSRGIPYDDIKENPKCLLIVTPKGGHLGWVVGSASPFGSPWTDPLVMDFLQHLENWWPSGSNSRHLDQATNSVDHLKVVNRQHFSDILSSSRLWKMCGVSGRWAPAYYSEKYSKLVPPSRSYLNCSYAEMIL